MTTGLDGVNVLDYFLVMGLYLHACRVIVTPRR